MSQPLCNKALISVRLVVMDHYIASPIHSLDPLVSDFKGTPVRKVPVLRVFGSTPAGQTCCLHLHGIFPYMFIVCAHAKRHISLIVSSKGAIWGDDSEDLRFIVLHGELR